MVIQFKNDDDNNSNSEISSVAVVVIADSVFTFAYDYGGEKGFHLFNMQDPNADRIFW